MQIEERGDPIMYLDVNLGKGLSERIVLCDGDDYLEVVEEFQMRFALSERKKLKLINVIKYQLSSMLTAINEEEDN
mgnify:CR=1 FL=1